MSDKIILDGDSSGAVRAVKQVEDRLATLNGKLSGFQSAIAGLALGGFITQALNATIAVQRMADATGIASSSVQGFASAITAAGGSTDRALDGISDLVKNLGDASRGSLELQKAFGLVGVSINDLRTLSEQDILRKTVAGLAAMPDSARRTAIGMQLMGESIKGINLQQVNRDLDQYIAKAGNMTGPMASAQKAQQNLAVAMENFRTATLTALAPLLQFLANLKTDQIERFITATVQIGAALASIAAGIKVFQVLGAVLAGVGTAFAAVKGYAILAGTGIGVLAGTVTSFKIQWGGLLKDLVKVSSIKDVFTALGTTIGVFVSKRLPFLLSGLRMIGPFGAIAATAIYGLNKALEYTTGKDAGGWFDKLIGKTKAVENQADKTKETLDRLGITPNETAGAGRGGQGGATADEISGQQQLREVIDAAALAYNKQRETILAGVEAYKLSNAEIINRLQQEGRLANMTEQQRQIEETLYSFREGKIKEVARLQAEYDKIRKSGTDDEKKVLPDIKAAIDSVNSSYAQQVLEVEKLARSNQNLVELRKQMIALSEFSIKTEIDGSMALRSIQDDIAKLTMTEIEKKYYDIARAAENSARAAIDAENSRRRAMGVPEMTQAEVQRYYEVAARGIGTLQRAQEQHYRQSRTWSTGWVKAFKEYREAAGDAASRAANLFKKATQGMEDAIVNFAKTGKFEWKSFVADMAEELLRGQIRQVIAKTLGPIADLMGLDLGNLGGQAPGGSPSNPMYVIDIAGGGGGTGGGFGGQRGAGVGQGQGQGGLGTIFSGVKNVAGQVWDTVKNVGSTIGNVFGGVVDTVSNIGSGIWDAVSGIGSSVMDFFGGFFANGGTLGAGKWGVVGERGPEIISGPATITPMNGMGGQQYVTYNINAVDASSFKALVARDPGFIHAVAMQGGMAIPSRR